MSRRNRKTSRRARARGSRSGDSNLGVIRMTGTGYPFYVGQTTSGTGGLYNQESNLSLSAAQVARINPYAIGGRLYQMASLFDQWRVNSMRFRYHPIVGPTGFASTPDAVAVSGGRNRLFVLEFFGDSATGAPNFIVGLSSLHKVCRTSDRCSLSIGRGFQLSNWLACSTSNSSPSVIDVRQSSPGSLALNFQDTSSTGGATYGIIEVEWDCSFRSPISYGNPVGLTAPRVTDEKKSDDIEDCHLKVSSVRVGFSSVPGTLSDRPSFVQPKK